MSGNHNFESESRRKTPWPDDVEKTPVQQFIIDVYNSDYEHSHPDLAETGEAKLINYFKPKCCPRCGAGIDRVVKAGKTENGIDRYKCNHCHRRFTPVTGTIFDGHKISITRWIPFLLNLFWHVSVNADSRNNWTAYSTARYWLEKTFFLLHEYYQTTPVLSGDVYIDETYYPVIKKDKKLKKDGTEPRGLSWNQICIATARTRGRDGMIYCAIAGKAKPSKRAIYNAYSNVIAPGSTLIHDDEKCHQILIDKLGLKSEVHPASETKGLADKDNPMDCINDVHALLKRFLRSHSGFNRDYLQGYLDLFCFTMNPPSHPAKKVEILLELAFKKRQIFRYRDLFSSRSREEDDEKAPF